MSMSLSYLPFPETYLSIDDSLLAWVYLHVVQFLSYHKALNVWHRVEETLGEILFEVTVDTEMLSL